MNAPGVVIAMVAAFVVIHGALQLVSPHFAEQMVLTFAFSSARYVDVPTLQGMALPGGPGAAVWSFFTYMFLHGSWTHLAVNSVWLLAFGSVVARRFGALLFIMFSLVCAAASAAANLAVYHQEFSVLVGASGAISGQMAAAVRLIYAVPGGLFRLGTQDISQVRALSIVQTLQQPGAIIFLLVWLVINLMFGVSSFGLVGEGGRIAWEAHVGGFIAGFFVFNLFDRLSGH